MKIGRKDLLVVGVVGIVASGTLASLAADSWRLALACLGVLQLIGLAIVLDSHRRLRRTVEAQDRNAARLEGAITNVSLRVVTESQSVRRTLDGQSAAIIKKIGAEVHGMDVQVRKTQNFLDRRVDEGVQETEALIQLFTRIQPRAAMPSSGRWALPPTGILQLLEIVESQQPKTTVELGSGTSSVWLAYALEKLGRGRLVSIDHDEYYLEKSRAALLAHGFGDTAKVEVRFAPLSDLKLSEHETPWYDTSVMNDLTEVDLLIVDGPPAGTGKAARYPAVPIFMPILAAGALVLLDDTDREAEKATIERWTAEYPRLTEIELPGPRGRQTILVLGTPQAP